jgi:hypothetical protein
LKLTTPASFWAVFFIPETKGLTLEEMESLFGAQGSNSPGDVEADRTTTTPKKDNNGVNSDDDATK